MRWSGLALAPAIVQGDQLDVVAESREFRAEPPAVVPYPVPSGFQSAT